MRIWQWAQNIMYVTHWNHLKFTCEKISFDLFKMAYYIYGGSNVEFNKAPIACIKI